MEMLQLQRDFEKLTNSAKLSDTLQDVDQIINLLSEAREKVASGELNRTRNNPQDRTCWLLAPPPGLPSLKVSATDMAPYARKQPMTLIPRV